MKRMIIASEKDSGFVIKGDEFESAVENGSWRYYDENLNLVVDLLMTEPDDDGACYEFLGASTAMCAEDDMYYYDLTEDSYSHGPYNKSLSAWQLIDWDKWTGDWTENRYGERIPHVTIIDDEDLLAPIKVPGWFVDKCRELQEYDATVQRVAWDMEENSVPDNESAHAAYDEEFGETVVDQAWEYYKTGSF